MWPSLLASIGGSALAVAGELVILTPDASSLVELALRSMALRDASGPRALTTAGWIDGTLVTAEAVAPAMDMGGRMAAQAAAMERVAEGLRGRVDHFLGAIRAA